MRRILIALSLLLAARAAWAGPDTYSKLMEDPEKAKIVGDGIKILKKYFKFDAEVEKGKRKYAADREEAMTDFRRWLSTTSETLGVDLRASPEVVCEILDRGRVGSLPKPRKRGDKIDYVKVDDARGIDRFEYSLLLPKAYSADNDDRYPLVISLHDRVINEKHRAFRGNASFVERSRQIVYNNWLKTPAAARVVVIAPTGRSNGFTFDKEPAHDLQHLYRAMGAGLTNYRTDWRRVFLEVHGRAIRVACEQTFMFAGFIVRDRVDDKSRPPIPEEEFFIFDNLNGAPLCYVADEARWEQVGKPMADALEAAYKKAGAPQNLLILKAARDADDALRADDEKLDQFLRAHVRPPAVKKFEWRFFNQWMTHPMPVSITSPNFHYEENVPLEKVAGALKFEAEQAVAKDEAGNDIACNVIKIDVTEAESLEIRLHDGLVDLTNPVSVYVNGKLIHDKVRLTRDWGIFIDDILPLRFFMIPHVAVLECEFKDVSKPQFVPPPPNPPPPGAGQQPAGTEEKESRPAGGDASATGTADKGK